MTVVVAHSGTDEGFAALRLAVSEATLRDAEVVIVRVVESLDDTRDENLVEELRADVAADLARAGAPGELTWRLEVVASGGDVAESIIDVAVGTEAKVLVIGSRHRTAVGKFVLGSTVQRVLLDAPMPVLVTKH